MSQNNKFFFVILFTVVLLPASFSQSRSLAFESYIEKYHPLAQKQQQEYGIPSSIILAQGLLESSAGSSYLAVNANNHFGIKCHGWTGEAEYRDDDMKGECFRKYNDVLDSYEDHSIFIANRARYKSLFELNPTDYEKWAHGLKKAGYATDPAYAYKLISIIENYDLHKYDKYTANTTGTNVAAGRRSEAKHPEYNEFVMGFVTAFVKHEVYYNNNVKCVVAQQGDTYGSIADEFNLTEKRIREYNDVGPSAELNQGDWVYIRAKKKKAGKKADKIHIVQEGESLYGIAQFYGIRLQSLFEMNDLPYYAAAQKDLRLKIR